MWIISFRQEDSEDWHLIVSVIIGLLQHILRSVKHLSGELSVAVQDYIPHRIVQRYVVFVAHFEHFASSDIFNACENNELVS